jgi:quercetin dioxygenase-like cupin family protein
MAMARPGDELAHPVTGERIIWRKVSADTQGALLEADLFAKPGAFVAAAHVHPNQEERFEILSGSLTVRVDGQERELRPGDVAVIPRGRPHQWWNSGDEEVHVLGQLRPALRTELFFETFFGLGHDGKTNSKGLPNPLQLAVLMQEYEDEMRLARPSPRMQKMIAAPLAAVGRLRGYRAWYPQYSGDVPTDASGSPTLP